MKKILIVGANGMLGTDLVSVFSQAKYQVIPATRKDFDLTNNQQVQQYFQDKSFDLVINSAAYTQVDKAESEEKKAFRVNEIGAKNLAHICNNKNIPIIYISTDYVFDGNKKSPYETNDQPNPINIYGKSKLAGEIATKKSNPKSYIIRTSWLYGKNGNNFVETMLKLAKTRDEIKVVSDQYGCPTWTMDLANNIKKLIQQNADFGTYHICSNDSCSWFEFAKKIFEINKIDITIKDITTEEFPRDAARPKNSIMKSSGDFNWQDSLMRYFFV